MKDKVEIIMRNLYKKELEQYALERDAAISKLLEGNIAKIKHRMFIGEDMEKIYNQLSDLERAELIDFLNLENDGRTD